MTLDRESWLAKWTFAWPGTIPIWVLSGFKEWEAVDKDTPDAISLCALFWRATLGAALIHGIGIAVLPLVLAIGIPTKIIQYIARALTTAEWRQNMAVYLAGRLGLITDALDERGITAWLWRTKQRVCPTIYIDGDYEGGDE